MKAKLLIIFAIFLVIGCKDDINNPNALTPIDVSIRMEVQILDSTYQLYSRPFTKIYFTTYKLGSDNTKHNFEQSDTTSCPNGWGVKLLNFNVEDENDKILLGASCEDHDGPNLRLVEIDYDEITRRIDSTGISSIVKTFAIYYQ